jgi:hypothetical protein
MVIDVDVTFVSTNDTNDPSGTVALAYNAVPDTDKVTTVSQLVNVVSVLTTSAKPLYVPPTGNHNVPLSTAM